ncbi:hypothetical protein GCM10010913_32920 [Paenibacillus aceti]|uniref:Uncharacterized protein n=1 Tax=Paenibacillus aceti TaxID=1820010 RepID=A0ABQ1W0J4_9BACL|nr:hypothetical protein GCM10010913_32920 [Paenibacillus aceti]
MRTVVVYSLFTEKATTFCLFVMPFLGQGGRIMYSGGRQINGRLYVRTRGGNWIALELLIHN